MPSNTRTYSALSSINDFQERFKYLRLDGTVAKETFGFDRHFNQKFYRSHEWKQIRDFVIVRDGGFDLGMVGYPIQGRVIIHHMNPVTLDDLLDINSDILDPEFLISVSHKTHNAIHYGDIDLLPQDPVLRRPGDTKLW